MLRYTNYSIVFQEIPDEVTLAIYISGCPNRCEGCHSPHLMDDTGIVLDISVLDALTRKYRGAITCVCFMGGDADPATVEKLCTWVKYTVPNKIKTAWYSGLSSIPPYFRTTCLDYIKLGPYVACLGGIDAPQTNQRFYKLEQGEMTDITYLFWTSNTLLAHQI